MKKEEEEERFPFAKSVLSSQSSSGSSLHSYFFSHVSLSFAASSAVVPSPPSPFPRLLWLLSCGSPNKWRNLVNKSNRGRVEDRDARYLICRKGIKVVKQPWFRFDLGLLYNKWGCMLMSCYSQIL